MSVVLGLPVEPTRNLRPWHVGAFAGEPVSIAGPKLEEFMTTRSGDKVPQGESFRDFLQRWRRELTRLLALMRKLDAPVIAVTHARNLYALNALLFGEEIPVKGPPHPGAIVELKGAPGEVTLRTLYRGHGVEVAPS